MSAFHLRGYTDSTSPPYEEDCDTADAALGIARGMAARGLVVWACMDREDGRWQELAIFAGNNMLPNPEVAPADNPLLALSAAGRAEPPRRTAVRERRAPPPT